MSNAFDMMSFLLDIADVPTAGLSNYSELVDDVDKEAWTVFVTEANATLSPMGLTAEFEMLRWDAMCISGLAKRESLMSPIELGCKPAEKFILASGRMRVIGRYMSCTLISGWARLKEMYPNCPQVAIEDLDENFFRIPDKDRFAEDSCSTCPIEHRVSKLEADVAVLQQGKQPIMQMQSREDVVRLHTGPFPKHYNEHRIRRGFEGNYMTESFVFLSISFNHGYSILHISFGASKLASNKVVAFISLKRSEAEALEAEFNGTQWGFGRIKVEPANEGSPRQGAVL